MFRSRLVEILMVLFASALLFMSWGCAGKNGEASIDMRDTLSALQHGKARGHLSVSTGGSPVAAGSKQVFFLGPENASLNFDGSVDFSQGEPIPLSDEIKPPEDPDAQDES